MKRELWKSVARAYLVFASIFLVGLTAGLVQFVIHGAWDWRVIAAAPITGFHMALQAIMKGGYLIFPLALAYFLARARWRRKKGGLRAQRGDGPVEPWGTRERMADRAKRSEPGQ